MEELPATAMHNFSSYKRVATGDEKTPPNQVVFHPIHLLKNCLSRASQMFN